MSDEKNTDGLIRNVIRDVRRKVKYEIYAKEKLDKKNMLKRVRDYNESRPGAYRVKHGSVVKIVLDD